ncbi:MAG: type II secretion system protein [Desulfobacteraceae bacterium]|nr:type II secretion system protein [Desulfobacteraceae bacterium]
MKRSQSAIDNPKGFTLLEIAIVMVIIGILTGGGVSLMKILTERKMRNETVDYLAQVRGALVSYAINNGRLPWADGSTAGSGDGQEDNGVTNGFLPYLTLQAGPRDPYKHVLRYEVNANLTSNSRATTCTALKNGLNTRPLVVDGDGSGTAFNVAFVLVSAGPMDADSNGNVFDTYNSGTHRGNNANGNPNYLRYPPQQTFDDLTVYIGGNELFGQVCEYLKLAVNNTSGVRVYVRDVTRGADLGFLNANTSNSYDILSGSRIEVRTAANGLGAIVSPSTPPTPVILAGRGATINIP